jgi:hypothetical protein
MWITGTPCGQQTGIFKKYVKKTKNSTPIYRGTYMTESKIWKRSNEKDSARDLSTNYPQPLKMPKAAIILICGIYHDESSKQWGPAGLCTLSTVPTTITTSISN